MEFADFFEKATGNEPFPYQARLAETPVLPDLLSVPTGCGKTAAAVLPWLWRRHFGSPELRSSTPRRLVFCLPMRVLVAQTATNVRTWLEKLGLAPYVGVHVLMGGEVDMSWDAAPDQNAILIGTQDQLLSRALNRGYAMGRFRWPMHFAWLNNDALWVLDETQLMGVGLSTSAQLQGLRESLGVERPTHTMWMSATLDENRLNTIDFRGRKRTRLELNDDDRIKLAERLSASKPIQAAENPFGKDGKALASEIIRAHRPGTRTLVVVNRVKRAQELAAALRQSKNAPTVVLIHSRFRPADRREAQADALASGFDGIVVATQAIEAGVDVTSATLFTEIASWSSMVQRFGRCNRYGEYKADEVKVRYFDVPPNEEAPYTADEIGFSRDVLPALTDVGPDGLANVPLSTESPALPVLRRKDLLDLFDTTPDLSGHDLDISGYIRDADDGSDVQVAWRVIPKEGPPGSMTMPGADELCRVRVSELRDFLRKQPGNDPWRWNALEGIWERTRNPVPGHVYVLSGETGGYDPALGWTGKATGDVPVLPDSGSPRDSDPDDPDTRIGDYVTLRVHSNDAAEAMRDLLDGVGGLDESGLLERAARWHDLGKVHPVFQEMLVKPLPKGDPRREGGPWAKSDRSRGPRCARPHFRHELASALAALEAGEPDLLCYLVAAHHGKVRTAIRSRPTEIPQGENRIALGVHEGDVLPASDLGAGLTVPETKIRLDVMELGEPEGRENWATRVQRLLKRYGPFRLAYLEAMVRAADWKASKKRQKSKEVGHA